jgi:hypothetical protein
LGKKPYFVRSEDGSGAEGRCKIEFVQGLSYTSNREYLPKGNTITYANSVFLVAYVATARLEGYGECDITTGS